MKKMLVLCLAIILCVSTFTACGGSAIDPNDPNQGLWVATTGEMLGISMEVSDYFGAGFTIELRNKGKCEITVDGSKVNGTWTLDNGAFTVKGGGIDSAGRLENGTLTLEDVMGMGITLIFVKEGSSVTPEVSGGTSGNDVSEDTGGKNLSEALQWWDGDWYGYWTMTTASGVYEDLAEESWDCAAVIDMQPDGSATIYLWDDYEEIGTIEIQVDENAGVGAMGGATSEGGFFYEKPLAHADWIIRPGLEAYDDYIMIDGRHKDSEDFFDYDEFTYEIYLRPWGKLWDDIPEGERPNNYDGWYLDSCNTPMLTALADATINGAPVFIHSAFSGSVGGSSGVQNGDDGEGEVSASPPPAALHPGEPSSTGDGYTSQENVYRTYKWLYEMDWDFQDESCTYEYVRDYIGVEGFDCGNSGPNSVSEAGDHYFNWYASETVFIHVGFRLRDNGTWTWCGQNSSGFSMSDLEDIVVTYD